MKFCEYCGDLLFLQTSEEELTLLCRHCGYSEKMAPKTSAEALVLETNFGSTTQSQAISQLNEFTKLDPTLPHLNTIPCPNQECPTQADPATRDILYIKTDAKNLKYQYCCMVCSRQWSS